MADRKWETVPYDSANIRKSSLELLVSDWNRKNA